MNGLFNFDAADSEKRAVRRMSPKFVIAAAILGIGGYFGGLYLLPHVMYVLEQIRIQKLMEPEPEGTYDDPSGHSGESALAAEEPIDETESDPPDLPPQDEEPDTASGEEQSSTD